ncbi:phage baseplate assembly protein V, partial [Sungkyunkwania multivorans]
DKSKVELSVSPGNTDALHYSVQSGESAFGYASRLAAQYGEWFYYDGKRLVFGRPEDGEEVSLTYGHDLQEFSLGLSPSSNSYRFFTNDYLSDDQHELATSSVSSGASGYNDFTSRKSDEIYSKETSVFLNAYTDPQLKQRLDRQVEAQKRAVVVNQVVVSGMSDNPGVSLGKVVKIQGDGTEHGSFRVTRVTHTGNENGMYQNRFEGLTAEIEAYPNTNITAYPKSDSQVGTVTDTADPDGYGRVKVQLGWQRPLGEHTPWLRVLTPHAGGEKGFHFIPEVGEEVLVGFEGGNAERP